MFVARLLQNRRVSIVSSGTAWLDYIPVKVEGTVKDSTNSGGYIEVTNVTGNYALAPWTDYTPVKFVTSGVPFSYNADGYIPIQFQAGQGFGDSTYLLDFAGTASLTPVVGTTAPTVTRALNTATAVNSSGLIAVVNANLPRFDYDVSSLRRNRLSDSTDLAGAWWFQSGATVVSNNSTTPPPGVNDVVHTLTVGTDGYTRTTVLGVGAGTQNTFSVYVKKPATGGATAVRLTSNNTSAWSTGIDVKLTLTTEWQRVTLSGTTINAGSSAYLIIGSKLANNSGDTDCYGIVHICAPQFESGASATAYLRSDNGTYGVSSIPCKGLLIEEARTNMNLYSEDFTQVASWAVSANCSIVGNQALSPDGTVTADQWSRTATSAVYVLQSHTKAASAITYTFSVYVKAGTGPYCALRLQATYPARADVVFNLSTGTISSAAAATGGVTGASATISNAGNGWYRCTITATTDATTALAGIVSFSANGVVVDGTDSSATSTGFMWGGQMEAGAFATSYIPTTTASVTRNTDLCSITTANIAGFNASEGTVFSSARSGGVVTTFPSPWWLDDTTPANALGSYFYTNIVGVAQINASVSQGDLNSAAATVINADAGARIAYGYKANDCALSANTSAIGGGSTIDTTVTLPTVTRLCIGHKNASNWLNGHVRSVAYWPTRLSNTRLQAVTA